MLVSWLVGNVRQLFVNLSGDESQKFVFLSSRVVSEANSMEFDVRRKKNGVIRSHDANTTNQR